MEMEKWVRRDLVHLNVCLSSQVLYETSSDEESGGEYEGKEKSSNGIVDLEDMGKVVHKMKTAKIRRREEEDAARKESEAREMVTPLLKKALTKQGKSL